MSYQVLARKWRPRTFKDIVGQEHVLRVLINALDKDRLHHAYLFAGTRGVGKTTLARIFAKCLNCETRVTSTPCDTCSFCLAIDAGKFLDLYEIDAASRTKVEDTRDLLDNVGYPPVQGRYKVYLIDEVHMLSGHSFNALLKTLEEPPPHVKFIFATTEPKRLPITILSRCLQFHLKHISREQISAQLQRVCDSEQISYEEKVLSKLAQAADGSLRDALSLLDQAIVYCQKSLTDDDINQMLGYIAQHEVARLLQSLTARDGKQLFDVLADLHRRGPDYHQVLAELITSLHQAAVMQVVPVQQFNEIIQEIAQNFSAEEIQLYYQIALLGRKDLPCAPSPAQGFEMIMLRMLAFRPVTEPFDFKERRSTQQKQGSLVKKEGTMAVSEYEPTKLESSPLHSQIQWRDILPKLELVGLAHALALNCNLGKITDSNVELILAASYKAMVHQKLVDRIEQALSRYFNKQMHVNINITSDEVQSPARQQEQELEGRRASILESLHKDPGVKKIKALFNAEIDNKSIEIGE